MNDSGGIAVMSSTGPLHQYHQRRTSTSDMDQSAGVTASIVQQHVERLLACVQPNQQSDRRRHAVASYVCELIKRCFGKHGQVDAFMFGSVPLHTYLPDGDVDISIFTPLTGEGKNELKETWAFQLKVFLEAESKKHKQTSSFDIEDCQIIQAEVKLVKCIISGLVVDISFNALGGLCAVAFLEWFDNTIGRSHLLKRSIVLVKAWCYYESRLLGAHHGLLSSYALETMVLFVINVYGSDLASPLEVFHRFLQVFAEFDFENYCLSMLGPIPLSSFPNPQIDSKQLPPGSPLLSPQSLRDAVMRFSARSKEAGAAVELLSSELSCSATGRPSINLMKKHLNIMDPLLPSNNLGRSVSKSSYLRIKLAFSHGATSLTQVLQNEPIVASQKISSFFASTWSSPHRLAVENGNFFASIGHMPSVIHTNMMKSALRHERTLSMDFMSRPGPIRRRGSTISLPDLSFSKKLDSSGAANWKNDDSIEVHMGKSDTSTLDEEDKMGQVSSPTDERNIVGKEGEKSNRIPSIMEHSRSASVDAEMSLNMGVSSLSAENASTSSSPPRPGFQKSGGSSSSLHLRAQQKMYPMTQQLHTLNFLHSGMATGQSVGDCYASDMWMLMQNISVARQYQPISPRQKDERPNLQKVTSTPGHADEEKKRVIANADTSQGPKKQEVDTNLSSVKAAAVLVPGMPQGITYASVTAHGLTPKTMSCPISRRDSMSVNASASGTSSEATSPKMEYGMREGKQTLTPEMIALHLRKNKDEVEGMKQGTNKSQLSVQAVDADSLSNKLRTWSFVAQQGRAYGYNQSGKNEVTECKEEKREHSTNTSPKKSWANVISRSASPR